MANRAMALGGRRHRKIDWEVRRDQMTDGRTWVGTLANKVMALGGRGVRRTWVGTLASEIVASRGRRVRRYIGLYKGNF